MTSLRIIRTYPASSNRLIGDITVFDYIGGIDPDRRLQEWETMYKIIMDLKYAKRTRNFSQNITGIPQEGRIAPIYLIPRQRGGPGYLSVPLQNVDLNHVQYCPISKGFSMQDVSSFTLGPIVGEGLCLVNAAFSKSICIGHIEGGGYVDLTRKNFWKKAKTPIRKIQLINNTTISIDNNIFDINTWLRNNEHLWFPQWEIWRRSIALCSKGDFHWTDNLGHTIAYRKGTQYLDFIQ